MKYLLFLFFCFQFFSTALLPQSILINEIMSSNNSFLTDYQGDYEDWIELYNSDSSAINLFGYSLSDDNGNYRKWILPNIILSPKAYLIIYASGKNITNSTNLHTNFKIKSEGEEIWLSDNEGNIIDYLDSITIPSNISYGRLSDSINTLRYFDNPTPGTANIGHGYLGISEDPIFSNKAGFYNNSIALELYSSENESVIYYTTDGSDPDANSTVYFQNFLIDSTITVKAVNNKKNLIPSKIITKTFFINENTTLPVIALSTDPDNLWDNDVGIYVDGTNGIPGPCSPEPKNYNNDWERPVTIEYYEANKNFGFGMECGMKIFGGCSRTYPLKSLALYARKIYGQGSFNYPIFEELRFDSYEAIVLRNSGDDYYSTYMRDPLMHEIVNNIDLETLAYKPVVVFLNGKYWGIHNLREKVNEHYLAQHNNIDAENIDLLEREQWIISGDDIHYAQMIEFIENNNLSLAENYEYVASLMDIDNFISYCISQIYFDNTDWPGHNIKYWRSRDNGKWRWILYDTDFGFGFKDEENYRHNTLTFVTDENGETNANPPWSTFLLRKLLGNKLFEQKFINTFADYSNTIFSANIVNEKITQISETIKPEIRQHIKKWGEVYTPDLLYLYWLNNIKVLKSFASNRLQYVRNHFIEKFQLADTASIYFNSNISDNGFITINQLEIKNFPWSGTYFIGNPISLKAYSKLGYNFNHWIINDEIFSKEREITIELSERNLVTAVFEPDSNKINKVIFNEINYKSAESHDSGDWFEIANTGEDEIDLSGWKFQDQNDENVFIFPEGTTIKPSNYLVIINDTLKFINQFPSVKNYLGNFDFKLSNEGEYLEIRDNYDFLVDSVTYSIIEPWPALVEGNENSIELKSSDIDNSLGNNWMFSKYKNGSPGETNSTVATNVIANNVTNIDYTYSLKQNFPNPFNPTTEIVYSIAVKSKVSISIYNILGEKIVTLVNEMKEKGNYRVSVNLSGLASGIYFCKLNADNFFRTRKMILAK